MLTVWPQMTISGRPLIQEEWHTIMF